MSSAFELLTRYGDPVSFRVRCYSRLCAPGRPRRATVIRCRVQVGETTAVKYHDFWAVCVCVCMRVLPPFWGGDILRPHRSCRGVHVTALNLIGLLTATISSRRQTDISSGRLETVYYPTVPQRVASPWFCFNNLDKDSLDETFQPAGCGVRGGRHALQGKGQHRPHRPGSEAWQAGMPMPTPLHQPEATHAAATRFVSPGASTESKVNASALHAKAGTPVRTRRELSLTRHAAMYVPRGLWLGL